MDKKEKVWFLSKLYSMRRDIFERCAIRLRRLRYQEIGITIPVCENNNESGEYHAELRQMSIRFCYQDYRYTLEVQCCDGYASPDNLHRIFPEITEYIAYPWEMCSANIGTEFPAFLEDHSFFYVSPNGEINSNEATLIAFRGSTKYYVSLHRQYKQDSQIILSDDRANTEIDQVKFGYYLERFQTYIEKHRRLCEFQGDYHIELSADLSQLDINLFQGWCRNRLTIRSEPLSVQTAEDLFLHLVHCWMYAKCKKDKFPDNITFFCLLAQNYSDDYDSFEVFSGGIKYSISTKTDELVDFDSMDGHVFERFCAEILAYNGFSKVQVTQGSRDQGIDIIAYKDDIRYGIQCKCYSTDIGNKAVQEVYAGKAYYNCDVAVVLTNRYFTKSAVELAQRNRVHLWDRCKLSDLIENCKDQLLGKYGN